MQIHISYNLFTFGYPRSLIMTVLFRTLLLIDACALSQSGYVY